MKVEILQDPIIEHLFNANGEKYNLHKASEECQELGLVLNQYLLKPKKIDQQEIIDEIGDVLIRVEILKRMFPLEDIQARVDLKLSKFKSYIDHEEYNKM